MNDLPSFSLDLVRRYDTPGPRYTSYPTAPQFVESFDAGQLAAYGEASGLSASVKRLSLYFHIPYCFSPCFYCGCNRIITRDFTKGPHYVDRLIRELALGRELLGRRDVVQLHLGGGTPNFLAPDQIRRIVAAAAEHFTLSSAGSRDFSMEIDPRHVRGDDLVEYAAMGFNRLSLGVQDFDAAVQRAVNREQSTEQVLEIIDLCRAIGFRSLNVDLIYGLPRQTLQSFERTLQTILAARPDRLAVYAYAHMPALFKAQRHIDSRELPDPESKLALLQLAVERLTQAGYRYIGMDHFALPNDELALAQDVGGLHRNFMGYTTHGDCDLLGVGVSAISHLGDCFTQNVRDAYEWESRLDERKLPVWRGLKMNTDDIVRADVIQSIMCQGSVDIAATEHRHHIRFTEYFHDALAPLRELERDGLAIVTRREVSATSSGRLLLRRIAMCFDRYADTAPTAIPPAVIETQPMAALQTGSVAC